MQKAVDGNTGRELAGDPNDELGLGYITCHKLVHEVRDSASVWKQSVAEVHILVEKDTFPGDKHVIEHGDCVHFIEACPEGMIIDTFAIMKRFAAEKTQAWGIQRECKAEGVFSGVLALHPKGRGKHRQLIRERRQCGQHACPAYDQASLTLLH